MDKLGQKRNILDDLVEATNITGIAAEKFFSKQFSEALNQMRKADDSIRAIVLGEAVSGEAGDVMQYPPTKQLLADAKSSMNQREYLECFTELGKVHEQFMSILGTINSLNFQLQSVHDDMLTRKYREDGQLTDEERRDLQKRRENLARLQKRLAAKKMERFVKEAGIMDFYKNISTKPGRALMAWEKKYPNEVNKWKNGTGLILENAKNIYAQLVGQLKLAGRARNKRNLDAYTDAINPLKEVISTFDKGFRAYYTSAVKPLLEKLQLDGPKEDVKSAPPAAPAGKPASELLQKQVTPPATPADSTITMDESDIVDESDTPTLRDSDLQDKMFELRNKQTHQVFINTLSKMGSEDPVILKLVINKYAKSIQATDTEIAVQLFDIARRIGK